MEICPPAYLWKYLRDSSVRKGTMKQIMKIHYSKFTNRKVSTLAQVRADAVSEYVADLC